MDHASSNKRKFDNPLEDNKLVKRNKNESFQYKISSICDTNEDQLILGGFPSFVAAAVDLGKVVSTADASVGEVSPPRGGERLKKYSEELSTTKVFIPERWNQEGLLMDWIDYSSFNSLLAPKGIDSARKALIVEAQRSPHQQEKRL